MKVSEIMSKSVVKVSPEDNVSTAARLLGRHNIGSLPVCAVDGRLRGIVTDRDIVLRCIQHDNPPERTMVREIMTRGVVSVSPEDDVRDAVRIMADEQVRRLPVVSGNRVVGMVSIGDMAKTDAVDMEAAHALGEISTNVRKYKKNNLD